MRAGGKYVGNYVEHCNVPKKVSGPLQYVALLRCCGIVLSYVVIVHDLSLCFEFDEYIHFISEAKIPQLIRVTLQRSEAD